MHIVSYIMCMYVCCSILLSSSHSFWFIEWLYIRRVLRRSKVKKIWNMRLDSFPFLFSFLFAPPQPSKLSAPTEAAGPGEITFCWLVSNLNRSPCDEDYYKKVSGGKSYQGDYIHLLKQSSHHLVQIYSWTFWDLLKDSKLKMPWSAVLCAG